MKIRNSFVSNSSSSSFVVNIDDLGVGEFLAIRDYFEDSTRNEDGWSMTIDRDGGTISGFTVMDNCSLSEFLEKEGLTGKFVFSDY